MLIHPAVREFEHAFAEYQQAVAARAFWMGRVGLYAVLRALGVGPDDQHAPQTPIRGDRSDPLLEKTGRLPEKTRHLPGKMR